MAHVHLNWYWYNQSVENPGVTFVKGASERNEFFEKQTNNNVQQRGRTNKAED